MPTKEQWNRAIRNWIMTAHVPSGGGGDVGIVENPWYLFQEQAPGDMLILQENGDKFLLDQSV